MVKQAEPKTLFKFFPMNTYSLSALANSYLYFSKPSSFNDPYDCYARIQTLVHKDVFQRFIESISNKSRIQKYFAIRKLSKLYKNQSVIELNSIPELMRIAGSYKDFYREKCGIACLSSNYDHPLMWAHYASGHKGFCLGFRKNSSYLANNAHCKPVDYVNELKTIELNELINSNPSAPIHTEIARRIVYIKHSHWSYENEWRIFHNHPDVKLGYMAEDVNMIIFGSRMDEEQKMLVRKLSSHLTAARFYQANVIESGERTVIQAAG